MKLINITKIYHNKNNDVKALNNINLMIPNLGVTCIVGPSGCGKTTLLNIISGKDKDFDGVIEFDGKVESITQNIELFENLSIKDNLLLVSNDIDKIHKLLSKFHLNDPHKRVKKLSVGEKKRVQIIRSLLSKANYIICDEPTAALDRENSELVMTLLKEISKEIGVIVVTHRIALVDQYADNVIQMGKGCILDSYTVNEITYDNHVDIKKENKNINKHLKILFKTMKSRWQENIFTTGLLFLGILVLFVSLFIFPSLNSSVQATTNWLNGKNVIITQPNEGNNNNRLNKNSDTFYFYDLYKKDDVYLVKDNIDGILGYRIGWDFFKYSSFPDSSYVPKVTVDELRNIIEAYKEDYFKTGVEPFYEYEFFLDKLKYIDVTYPNDSYPEDYHNMDFIYDYSNYLGLRTKGIDIHDLIPYVTDVCIINQLYMIVPYQLFDDINLELMCGEMPKQNNEIILSKNLAEGLMYELELESLEDLVGKELPLAMQRIVISGSPYDLARKYTIVISGVTYMESQFENQVFFMDGAFDQLMADFFDYDPEIATYQYIHFLTDPLKDSEVIAEQINRLLESKESKFMVYNEINVDTSEDYQEPYILSIFVIFALVTLLVLYIIMQVLLNKRILKENSILVRYNYNALALQIVRMSILLGIVGIMQIGTLSSMCNGLNTIVNNMGFADIVSYDIFVYLKSLLLMAGIVVLLEGGFYAIRTKKYS